MSRIAKENERYISRVKQSIDREKNFRIQQQRDSDQARHVRQHIDKNAEQRDERNMKISQQNSRYSDLWILTTGLAVPQVISLVFRGGDAGMLLNKLDVRVYNQGNKNVEDINLITLIKILHDKVFPNLQVSPRGQVTLDDLVLPAGVYFFIRYHWLLSTGQAQNQYNLQTESDSPITVTITTQPED